MLVGAIDIGGTKTIVGIINEQGDILAQRRIPTERSNCSGHLERCAALLRECADAADTALQTLCGVGISIPGTADCASGMLIHAPGAGWYNIPVADIFRSLLKLENIHTDNDVNNCARAELRFTQAPNDFLWITMSTGIGCAIVAGGQVQFGANGCSGELGHYKVERVQPALCACGQYGCLEAHASGTAITREFRVLLRSDATVAALLAEKAQLDDAAGCAALTRSGCAPAQAIFDRAGEYLGDVLAPSVSLLNPAQIYIGGGVSSALPLLYPSIQKKIAALAAESCKSLKITATALGYEASLLGAGALVLEKAGKMRGIV